MPDNWEWCRFGSYTLNRDNERKPVSSVQRKKAKKMYDYYGASGVIDQTDSFLFDEKLLLIGEDGANLLTRTKPIAFLADGKYWVNNHAHCIDSIDKRLLEFICIYINAINLFQYITGSAQPKLNQDNMNRILIPIPPKAEQEKILERIKIILSNINDIDLLKGKLQSNIANAKSKILDLAIRGKLVPQDPNDEPASVLLERIKAEKEELIKQGKIKRDKKESVIFKGDDNSYYQNLPENWEICSIMAIAEVDLGKTLDKNKSTGKFYPYLRSVNIKWNEIDLSDIKEMQFEKDELQRYSIVKGDLLICEGGDVGRCCIWSSDEIIYYQNALHRVRFHGGCEPKYFLYFMMYLEHTGYLKRISNGVTIKHLTKTVLSTIPFTLPPIAEQKRIVEAIETIFAELDEISKQVT